MLQNHDAKADNMEIAQDMIISSLQATCSVEALIQTYAPAADELRHTPPAD